MTRRQADVLCYVSFIAGTGAGILVMNPAARWWMLLIYGMSCGLVVTMFIRRWTTVRRGAKNA